MKLLSDDVDEKKFGGDTPYRLTSRIAGCKGIEYSSPTLSSAISNLTPAFTFMLAVFFRMEQVMLRSSATQAKINGTIVSISGALVIVLYKGPKLLVAASFTSCEPSWIIGGLLLALQFLLLSVWYILQEEVDSVISDIPRDGPRRPIKNAVRDWVAIFRTAFRAGQARHVPPDDKPAAVQDRTGEPN
ncbi:WAT1-related protein At4g15540-like isoform X2 [Brassica rapa]|uniref:WAT1-related protein At4g15540-like isoform X2 n=1 Tax=Brassica campestris TaxID=3711 RepID=UPI00142E3037|nr:WAT1-related protein At4g15540-like isoform X2 [Brassica rapa]